MVFSPWVDVLVTIKPFQTPARHDNLVRMYDCHPALHVLGHTQAWTPGPET